jgi:nicotinamide-nucleotide amidase
MYVRGLATAGLYESRLFEIIEDLIPGRDDTITLAFLPGYAGVELRLSTRGSSEPVDRLAEAIIDRLGDTYLGDAAEQDLIGRLSALLTDRGDTLATAESCTGGWIGKLLTDRPGSSAYFRGGVVAYSNDIKVDLLSVPAETIERHGAVSPETAEAMAAGARGRFGATYALSVTGIAGPEGGTADKPVGLIYLGLATPDTVRSRKLKLPFQRDQNRIRSAYTALNFLRQHLEGHFSAK